MVNLDLMIDNETLDTTPNAVILSIGAVKFDKHGNQMGEKFYAVLDIEEQKAMGRTVSIDTLEWWSRQSKEARVVLETTDRRLVKEVLDELYDFIFDMDGTAGRIKVWGNGSDFDNPQIASLFKMYDYETLPWEFRNNRCFRTLKAEFGHLLDKPPKRTGTYHNALDDAITQAEHCQKIFARLKNNIILTV
jgi:hypothetical protein